MLMKYLIILLAALSATTFAHETPEAPKTLSSSEVEQVEVLLTEAAAKSIYVTRHCDKPIDVDKFKELAKIKAFSEGFETIEGISWDNVKEGAHKQYDALNAKAPKGELCVEYLADLKGKYRFLKDIDAQ